VESSKLTVNISSIVETDFRERYNIYLRTKKQRIFDKYIGFNELEDERKIVNQQVMRSPGRRGRLLRMKR